MQKVIEKKEKSSQASRMGEKSGTTSKSKKSKGWEMTANEALRVNYVDHEISSQT